MSAIDVPPGWHPDPADPASSYRWWDGTQWTEHTRQAGAATAGGYTGAAGGYTGAPAAWPGDGYANQPMQAPASAQSFGAQSFGRRNQGSLTAIGVAALYVLVAVSTHVVFFGIVPAAAAVRAFKRREPLAPVAAVAAVIAIVVAFTALTH